MKKSKITPSEFIINYDKGISQKQKRTDIAVTIFAWLIWIWLSYQVISSYINYGSSHFGNFFKTLGISFEASLIIAFILIMFGIHNAYLYFHDHKHSPDQGQALPLNKTASYFEIDEASASIAQEEKKVDVEVDEYGKVISIKKYQD